MDDAELQCLHILYEHVQGNSLILNVTLAFFAELIWIVLLFPDGELNVLEDILTDAPDQDDELYNPESEHDVNEKKGTCVDVQNTILKHWPDQILFPLHPILTNYSYL